jgi:hypothetical protein
MAKAQQPKRDTRFQPGVSGNPKGRPRKPSATTQARDILTRLLEEVVAHRNGVPVTALEAMGLKVRNMILEHGRLGDFTHFVQFCQKYGILLPPTDDTQEQQTGVLLVRQAPTDPHEWERLYGEAARGKPPPEEYQHLLKGPRKDTPD